MMLFNGSTEQISFSEEIAGRKSHMSFSNKIRMNFELMMAQTFGSERIWVEKDREALITLRFVLFFQSPLASYRGHHMAYPFFNILTFFFGKFFFI